MGLAELLKKLNFEKGGGLIPVVTQDEGSGMVLMQAFVNREALVKTLETGKMHYWSRSRNKLWMKGEESKHYQYVKEVYVDCNYDSLLFKVEQIGYCCHEGYDTCFHNKLVDGVLQPLRLKLSKPPHTVLSEVYSVIVDRLRRPRPGSYVATIKARGEEAVIRKVGEEADELMLAAKEGDRRRVINEAADLIFHTLLLMASLNIELDEVYEELRARRKG
ncbi:MAG: bifunctional phosphoribosyl-AMP cyclohydrolase/phosphoribosyl-ATP diphosphatase HisIE [Candidatus Nezhaarchaeales archaeon]